MNSGFLIGASVAMIATALTHSFMGERRLIIPLLARSDGVTASDLARQVIRGAWHLTSVLMVVTAAMLWLGPTRSQVLVIGLAYLATAILDVILTRGRHIGWPLLALAGGLALASLA